MGTEDTITEFKKVFHQKRIGYSLRVVEDAEVYVEKGYLANELIYKIETYVTTEKLVGDTKIVRGQIDFPSSPWQFFKENHQSAWWMSWLVKLKPIKTEGHSWARTVTFERYAYYPWSTVVPKSLGAPVLFEQFNVEGDLND